MAKNKLPLQSSSNANIKNSGEGVGRGKTIEETYQKKTQLEHILLRPDTYIGSVEKHTQTLWVWEDESMVQRSISYVPGLYKIFDEILVNAADNKQRDPNMDSLKVVIDPEENLISVYNNGDGVPVEIHQEEGIYVPELIFGHLLTSSNYDDTVKKTTGGRNGYGAKLTNIFSTEFVIETADGKRQRKYKQVFTKNMGQKSEPVITTCKSSENWTKVTFKPDLDKFNMIFLEHDVVALMKKRVIDMGACLGTTVKVELNGKRIPVKSFREYCDLYLKSSNEMPENPKSEYLKVNDRWEICVCAHPGGFQQVSFVNSIATIKGGTHVDYVANQIAKHISDLVNKKNKNANTKPKSVLNYLWVFVNALIDNPAFDSQTKENLTLRQSSFGSKCELPPEFLKKVEKIGIVEAVQSWADFQKNKALSKTDGKKSKRVLLEKLEDANFAGTKNSDKCTLILTEGDSAKALAVAGITIVGRDRYGVFPLRGKLLNVREASPKQLEENKEIKAIKQILGLQHNKDYVDVKSLRYGHLMIMTDQDHDGSHIKGLLINFIHSFWPSLLKVPSFLVEFITPIVKAEKNGTKLAFYSMPEYEAWKESVGNNARGWSIKYYKGLGTSTAEEGKDYFRDLEKHKKNFLWADDRDGEAIELAFSKKKIEARKNWLRQFEPGTHLDQNLKSIKYTDFVNKELILFSMADLQRSIPSMLDGLKPGQRKILFCAFKRNFIQEAKVSEFSGYVSEHSAYHHGDQSLQSTIVGMAQTYVGSNNINLLKPNGQFGTRSAGGKDHAHARYIYTLLSPVTRYLFCKEDDVLLNYLNEDGKKIEPTWYMPIIPTVLVNGSEGIGTGWSSYIPNYNPRDIIANVRRLLNDEPMIPMDPWYRGFHGIIEKTATKETGATYTISGIIEEVDETTLRITELPIRRWTEDYKQFLTSMMDPNDKGKDPFIKEMREYHDVNTVHFELELSEENLMLAKEEGLLKRFKLTTSISTSNMHLFDSRGVIKKYDTPEQILQEFYEVRLEFYGKRKRALLESLETELLKTDNKVRFILGVVRGEIIVSNRKRAELFQELREKGFTPFPKKSKVAEDNEESEESEESIQTAQASDYDYLLSMSIGSLTVEKVEALLAEREKLNEEVEYVRRATPKFLWLKDLDALEKQLDEQEKLDKEKDAENKKKTKGAASKAGVAETKKAAKKPPRNKKTTKEEPVAEPMEISTGSAVDTDKGPEVVKPKGRGASKKAPAKGKSSLQLRDEEEDDDDEVLALNERLAAHSLHSSPDHSEETGEAPKVQRKQTSKRTAAAATKKSLSTVSETIDDDDDVHEIDISDDDFEPEVVVAEKKKGGRKPANPKASKPPAAAAPKKRGAAAAKQSQKLITEVFKPSENPGISPEKKVRKMRVSPFNKKSGSVLGRAETSSISSMDDSAEKSDSISGNTEESANIEVPRTRPQRGNRTKATYVISDSDEDDANDDDSEPEEINDSDFDEDDE